MDGPVNNLVPMTGTAMSTERRDAVMIIHLDDGKANALSFDLIAAIDAAITEAERDVDVGAVVLHGREGRFSGGFDLGVMFGDDFGLIMDLVADGGSLVRHLYGCGVPVVAAVPATHSPPGRCCCSAPTSVSVPTSTPRSG